jgi:hypothetical protein
MTPTTTPPPEVKLQDATAATEPKAHPLVAEASLLISVVQGALVFPEAALLQIRRALTQLPASERRHAIGGLVDLAAHLELNRKAPQAANALLLAIASIGPQQP